MDELNKNTSKSRINEVKINKDLYFVSAHNNKDKELIINKSVDKRFIQFFFCTHGKAELSFNKGNYKMPLLANKSLILYNPTTELPIHLEIEKETKIHIVLVTLSRLHELFVEYSEGLDFIKMDPSKKYYAEKAIFPAIEMILHQMDNYPVSPVFKNIYFRAKILELLVVYFNGEENKADENCPFLSDEQNILKIKEAKEILINNMTEPPLLSELAKMVGINEYKLKAGFKNIYNNTVFGYLRDYKMEYARKRIEESNLRVKEIAFEIGYDNPSHFITAFKKKFGITPKKYSENL